MDIDITKSDFNKTIVPWLGKTMKMMSGYICRVLQEHNISITREQWIILKILHEDYDGFDQNAIAQVTNRNKASMTRLFDVMEKNNLIVRIPSKEDARKNLIYITKTGKATFLETKPVMLKHIRLLEAGLTESEKDNFISTLKKIQYNINSKQQ